MNSQKHLFNLRKHSHYLNCAYKAPLLKSAEAACLKALTRESNPSDIKTDDFFNDVIAIKAAFSTLIHGDPDHVVVIPSTSYGFASVLNNITPKKNGYAICIQDEFPSGYFAIHNWCRKNDNTLLIASPKEGNPLGKSWNESILSKINNDTSVVIMSSVHWMNGLKFDLEAIGEKCKKHGAYLIVDGSQSVGAMPMDVKKYNIDALICASYKWLFGPYSMALAYINEKFDQGVPLEESWMNRTNAKNFSALANYDANYQPGAARYNVGETSNLLLAPILLNGLNQINSWNPKKIQHYCTELTQPLIQYLNENGLEMEEDNYRSPHLFALELPSDVDSDFLKRNLSAHNVYVSVRGKYIRVSVNVFNDEADIDTLIQVIKETVGH